MLRGDAPEATVESCLEGAIFKAGGIMESNLGNPSKVGVGVGVGVGGCRQGRRGIRQEAAPVHVHGAAGAWKQGMAMQTEA